MKITRHINKLQSQTCSPSRTSAGNTNIEDIVRHAPKIFEKLANGVKTHIHEAIEEIRSQITSQIKINDYFNGRIAQHS